MLLSQIAAVASPIGTAIHLPSGEKRGLNPNIWFGNVEQIVSERIGRETVTYVSNIYKYYVAYKLIVEENKRRNEAKSAIKKGRS